MKIISRYEGLWLQFLAKFGFSLFFFIKKQFIVLCILAAAFTNVAVGREWGMCELAREMHAHGFSRNQLDDWMCLVRHESGYKQTAINPNNSDGSTDWGLFQINDRYWCKNSEYRIADFFWFREFHNNLSAQKYNRADKNHCGMDCQCKLKWQKRISFHWCVFSFFKWRH